MGEDAGPIPRMAVSLRGVPRPYRHELDALRYCGNANVAAVQTKMAELIEQGRTEPDALHEAVDAVIGDARVQGEAQRKAKRIEKYGYDPIPEVRRTKEERAAVRPRRAEYAQRALARNIKRRKGLNRKQRQASRPWAGLKGGLSAYARLMLHEKRREKISRFLKQASGLTYEEWPKKQRRLAHSSDLVPA
jgi:hypothetical protein